jgi:hypothetical protein
VDAEGLVIDDQALESLSNATEVGLEPVPDSAEPPSLSSERLTAVSYPSPEMAVPIPPPKVYRDADGTPPPPEVLQSLAQSPDPELEPTPPQDDPLAATDRLLDGLHLVRSDQLAPSPQPPAVERPTSVEQPPLVEKAPEKSSDGPEELAEDWSELSADLAVPDWDTVGLDAVGGADSAINQASLGQVSLNLDDANLDQPSVECLSLTPAPKPAKSSPDSSTAVIVNYLEDAEDSFFEVEGQASVLTEEEDMDIDFLDQAAGPGVLSAKPMTPVPRKAI